MLFLLAIEILIVAPQAVERPIEKPNFDPVVQDPSAQQVLKGIHLIEAKEGRMDWELWAETAFGYKEKGSWKLDKVKVQFFSSDGMYYIVNGDKGIVRGETKDLEIEGNVVTQSSNGYVFKTSKTIYSSKDKKLFNPEPVQMTGGPIKDVFHLSSLSMIADLSTDQIFLKDKVEAQRATSTGKVVRISSQQAQFSNRDSSGSFRGNVVIESDGAKISGPEARFVFDSQNQFLQSMSMGGGVKIVDSLRWAEAENLEIKFVESEYRLTGNPRLIQNQDELIGEEIIFKNEGKRVQVRGAKARMESTTVEGKSNE